MTGKQDGWYSQPNEEVQIDFQEEMNPYEYAYWLADKIPAYGDYTKEAAQVLQRQADEIEHLQKSINDLYDFVGRDFAHLEPKQALEAHMAAVVKDAVAEMEERGEPDGWQLVPKQITQKMHDCGYAAWKGSRFGTGLCNAYEAMIAAAPSPEDK